MSLNHQDFNGKLNPRYGKGKYLYIFSSKEKNIKTKSLTEFCKNQNLNLNTLNWCFRVGRKFHKGWEIKRILLTS